jgi:ATPase
MIAKVYEVRMTVKVPSGMFEADLARPVVIVNDFYTGKLEFEIYSYGEETIVVPVSETNALGNTNAAQRFASEALEKRFMKYSKYAKIEVVSSDRCKVYVPEEEIPALIGKNGQHITLIETELGIKIDVEKLPRTFKNCDFNIEAEKRYISIYPTENIQGQDIDVYIDGEYLLSAKVSKKNLIKLSRKSEHGKILYIAKNSDKKIEIRV